MKEILNSIFVRALGWLRQQVSKWYENAIIKYGDRLIKIVGFNRANGFAGFVHDYNLFIMRIYRRKALICLNIIDALRKTESKIKNE